MKILKLIGILLALVVAIIGAIYLPQLFGSSEDDDFVSTDIVDVSTIRSDFLLQWDNTKFWDENIHQEQRDKVLRYKNNKMLSKASYEALVNLIREAAINKVCTNYNDALKANPFNHTKLITIYNNVPKVKKVEGLDTIATADHRIAHVEKLHKYYRNARGFAESQHKLTASLDTTTLSWKSFNDLKQAKLATARNYRNNSLYSEVSHISVITEGLVESEVEDRIEAHRDNFYLSLYTAIVDYFNIVEASHSNLNRLNAVRNGAFKNEAPENYKNMLIDYYFEFEESVEKAEESSNN